MLALRVWKSDEKADGLGGPYERNFLLGPIEYLVQKEFLKRNSASASFMWFHGGNLSSPSLFSKKKSQWSICGLVSFQVLMLRSIHFWRSRWKFVLTDNFNLLKELEYFAAYTFVPVTIQFLWPLINRRISTPLRIYQLSYVLLALICLIPGLRLNIISLPIWEFLALSLPFVSYQIIQSALKGHAESKQSLLDYLLRSQLWLMTLLWTALDLVYKADALWICSARSFNGTVLIKSL